VRVAIIPARGGSKRIPQKNIKVFCGLPMIAWSIRAAINSKCFDHIIVSTDDQEIANVASSYGADIPFLRPAELSNDYVGTMPVVAHALDWFHQNVGEISEACCIYATAPFIRESDLQLGLSAMQCANTDFAFSVTTYPFPIQRAIRITCENRVEMFQPNHFNTRSQDLEEAWHDAGQFYWGKAIAWISGKSLFGDRTSPVIIPRYRVQDIDTPEDWQRAEWMFRALSQANQ